MTPPPPSSSSRKRSGRRGGRGRKKQLQEQQWPHKKMKAMPTTDKSKHNDLDLRQILQNRKKRKTASPNNHEENGPQAETERFSSSSSSMSMSPPPPVVASSVVVRPPKKEDSKAFQDRDFRQLASQPRRRTTTTTPRSPRRRRPSPAPADRPRSPSCRRRRRSSPRPLSPHRRRPSHNGSPPPRSPSASHRVRRHHRDRSPSPRPSSPPRRRQRREPSPRGRSHSRPKSPPQSPPPVKRKKKEQKQQRDHTSRERDASSPKRRRPEKRTPPRRATPPLDLESVSEEEREDDCLSSVSLSLSPSPERRPASPPPLSPLPSGLERDRHSPVPRRTPTSPINHRQQRRTLSPPTHPSSGFGARIVARSGGSFDQDRRRRRTPPSPGRRSPSPPSGHRRRSSFYADRPPPLSPPRSRGPDLSWESKVEAFMSSLGTTASPAPTSEIKSISPTPMPTEKPNPVPEKKTPASNKEERADPPPPGLEEEEPEPEDLKITPLVRFISQKLTDRQTPLRLEGVFEYSLLSLLSRAEWVAAKTVQLLEQAGYNEDNLYFLATASGGPALETELKSAVFTGKVRLGSKPELVAQVLLVVEYIVKYFTCKDSDGDDDKDEEEEEDGAGSSNAVRTGLGAVLQQLAAEEEKAKPEPAAVEATAAPAPPEPLPVNAWAQESDRINLENLQSFEGVLTTLAKDMLRLGDDKLCAGGKAFDVAHSMVYCLVLAGYNLNWLQQLVMKTDDILPPVAPGGGAAAAAVIDSEKGRKKSLYSIVLSRLKALREDASDDDVPRLSDTQLEYLVRKCLIYVMRGCGKWPQQQQQQQQKGGGGAPAPVKPCNVVFNYLPEGLRELENRPKKAAAASSAPSQENADSVLEDGTTPAQGKIAPEDKESTDPLNSILCPGGHGAARKAAQQQPNELPNRRYQLGYVHAEWVVVRGKPQIYELSLYMSDLTGLKVYMVPEALRKHAETLERLGFVENPIRNEYYFAKKGLGCETALSAARGAAKLAQFLEAKRHCTLSESKNNGLVLNFYDEEELSIVARFFEESGHKNLFLDTVKGLGCVERLVERRRREQGKKLSYSGPKLQTGAEDWFYDTEVGKDTLNTSRLVSKSKAEALFQALEFFLDAAPGYDNYVRHFCFPPFSPRMEACRARLKRVEELYYLEVFMSARLNNAGHGRGASAAKFSLIGVYQCQHGLDLGDDAAGVVAGRFCRLLVDLGFDRAALTQRFRQTPEGVVTSNMVLERMASTSDRLKVTDQTMRCIKILEGYFQPKGKTTDQD